MSSIALTVLVLSLVAVIGLWLGDLKIKGVGLGIGGVLFGGLLVGHFTHKYGLDLHEEPLHFIKEFGLILFVYTIGVQVGPGFFPSLKRTGLRLNALAAAIVVLSGLCALVIHWLFDVPVEIFLGIYSGAVTNTPSLAAGQGILTELGVAGAQIDAMPMAYAMAYPFGILGILFTMWALRIAFNIKLDREADQLSHSAPKALKSVNVVVTNQNLNALTFSELTRLIGEKVLCSRVKSAGQLAIPNPEMQINVGDFLHLVGSNKEDLHAATLIIGAEVEESMSTKGTTMRSERIVVTNEKILGKNLRELNLKHQYNVVISRINRAGVELIANRDTSLQFGDIVNVVGSGGDIDRVAKALGNISSKLQHVQMLPIFIGVGLGVLLGSIPLQIPGLPAAIKLGLAGGPLLVAIALSRIGSIGRLYWFMPPSANLALREIGIVLFLAVVGLNSGAGFFNALVQGDGFRWMAFGVFITLLPLLLVGFFARAVFKLNYLSLCGLLAGSMTDPPALAFANALLPGNGSPALAYATVYPLVMCLRILSPQIIAVMLWVA